MRMRSHEYGKADDDHPAAHGFGDGDDSDGSSKHGRSGKQHWAFFGWLRIEPQPLKPQPSPYTPLLNHDRHKPDGTS